MNLLNDIITYVRRIIKSASNAEIPDSIIIDYINRFYLMDVDARMQLFDFKTKYQFLTQPGVDQYNMPLYSVQVQPGAQIIAQFPVYQGFLPPVRIQGINATWYTQRSEFFNLWPNYVQQQPNNAVGTGDINTVYQINIPFGLGNTTTINQQPPNILRGHVDITGIISSGSPVDPIVGPNFNSRVPTTSVNSAIYFSSIDANGNNVVVADSGQFLENNVNCGLLMVPGQAPLGNTGFGTYTTTLNVINYVTGIAYVTFPVPIPLGQNISSQCLYYQPGLPRAMLYYNNTITLRNPPALQYLIELDAYLTPAAFLVSSQAIPFGYMAEYIARGAARKILSDTGDIEQFMFYEQFFKEQELLVWKRSQRQWTSSRTQTIYSNNGLQGNASNGIYGSGAN